MDGWRYRRWANIKPALAQGPMLVGYIVCMCRDMLHTALLRRSPMHACDRYTAAVLNSAQHNGGRT